MLISQIVACSRNRVIGYAGSIPWHVPGDLQRFKRITMGHTLLFGRKTFEGIGQPLPGRRTIVVSRQSDFQPQGVQVVADIDAGISLAQSMGESELFVCGGGQIYQQTLAVAQRLYVSQLDIDCVGDAFYPPFSSADFVKILTDCYSEDVNYSFAIWQRLDCKDALGAQLLESIKPGRYSE
jgi:dihydrofolate reductase